MSPRPDYRAMLLKLSTLAEGVACARGIASALTDLPGSEKATESYMQAVRAHEHQLRNVEAVMVALWEMREKEEAREACALREALTRMVADSTHHQCNSDALDLAAAALGGKAVGKS